MSTISAASQAFASPKQRLLDSIASKVSTGSISSTDQTALDKAVESIDSSLKTSGASSATRLDPSDLKGRVDDLITQQVNSGTLTSDQADTLKHVLASGHGGHRGGAGGPPPADDGSSDPDDTLTSVLNGSSTTATASDSSGDLLASFIKQLQTAQSQTSAYGSSGSSGRGSANGPLLLNYEA